MQVFKSEQVRAAGGVHFLFVCFCKKWIVLIVLFCFRGGHVWSRLPPGYRRGRQTRQSMQQVGGEGWGFFFNWSQDWQMWRPLFDSVLLHFFSLAEQESLKPEHLLPNTFSLNRDDRHSSTASYPMDHGLLCESTEKPWNMLFFQPLSQELKPGFGLAHATLLPVTCFSALSAGYMFVRATCFTALGTGCMFSRTNRRIRIGPMF